MTNTTFSREQFLAFRSVFRNFAEVTSSDIIVYNLLRGLPADRGFSPIVNATKLKNGTLKWNGFILAKDNLKRLSRYYLDTLELRYQNTITKDQLTALIDGL